MARRVRRVKYKPRARRRNPRRRRRNPSSSTMLWLAVIGGGAFFLWKKSQAKKTAAPAPTQSISEPSGAAASFSASFDIGTGSLGSLGGSTLGTLG